MGLAGRKQKQRIPNDPRNLSWADDAARFGQSYMSKLGWDPSKGLGASGEGMKSHLKVSQKLDMLGIGAAHQQDPHGIAWKQNKDFEVLLKRLNAQDDQDSTSTHALGEFVRPEQPALEKVEEDGTSNQLSKKEKKRRRKEGEDSEDRKEKKKYKKERNQHEDVEGSAAADSSKHSPPHIETSAPALSPSSSSATTSSTQIKPKGRPMAHRARIQAAKRLANKSAAAISEILGIAPTPSPAASLTPSGSLTPITPTDNDLPLEKLTISNKSVADYFKEKLDAKSGSHTPATSDDVSTSHRGMGFSSAPSHDDDDRPRMGLGAGRKSEVEEDADRPRAGIGGLSNAFAQFFAASSSSHATVVQMASSATQAIIQPPATTATSHKDKSSKEETTEKQRRKAKKKEVKEGFNAEEVHVPLEIGSETPEGSKVEKKKRKEEKRKMESTEPSDLALSTAVEEPEGSLESDRKRRKEDKKKKKAKCHTAQEPSIDENVKSESKDEKRSKKSKKRTETVAQDA
ncbi:hypothetical protein K503DRAFT_851381 [Rhizopogon vinicolor AM-OR11-026]|uniref:G-patch domain-containing protein n=1 Tax=Rhizopogon vinicolor AM-OR11-026 TaxID=1314800 RepID=A0A1B7MR85_9AGAM|nr:hypothetical protein K503DRAFT_851381 [Rhizopogon vinicolor AM-OR11-026]